jgi:hypothetical protein
MVKEFIPPSRWRHSTAWPRCWVLSAASGKRSLLPLLLGVDIRYAIGASLVSVIAAE